MNRRHMTDDHHGRTSGRATLLVRAVDEILGTHKMTRYQDYEAHLQDRTTGEIFGRAAALLKLAAARATAPAETLAAPDQLSETSRSASDGR